MFHRKGSVCSQDLVPHEGDVALWQKATVHSDADMKQSFDALAGGPSSLAERSASGGTEASP
jgi:hypothetical protein